MTPMFSDKHCIESVIDSVVWIFYQIQIKSTIAYNLGAVRISIIEEGKSASVGKDMEKNPWALMI